MPTKKILILAISSVFLISCHSSKMIVPIEEEIFETIVFDTLEVEDHINDYNYQLAVNHRSPTRTMDLLHTKLEVSFDWQNQYLIGKAYLQLKPYFFATSSLTLDAKTFDIKSVKNYRTNQDLLYTYDNNQLHIELDKSYDRDEIIEIFIEYIAKPNEGNISGSASITSNKGLYFINATNKDPFKMQQLWTQGETESNSKWFPTIDKPNERCTQEIYITVQDTFLTLSNGLLISSKDNNDGTRTDYWKMEKPHAPYLFMMAVGTYAKVTENWKDISLSYYVEPEYKSSARDIFGHTVEMLDFFSEITGVEYPWDKFDQIVVRDFVSGAMENTTAVIFGSFVQKTTRELLDSDNDMIVAHEMFHHWFGDYVTCESWSNITLNEGFANYGEYLWKENKYGRKAADQHKYNERIGYLRTIKANGHPLIHFGYDKREDMFDTHSYNKGGLVLHMLRKLVGNDAFFASLNRYLTDNAFTAVEADELRMAFEDTTGQDLRWFFDQWFFSAGHPELDIEQIYVPEQKIYNYKITQTQDAVASKPIFILPVTLGFIYEDGTIDIKTIEINQREETFVFECEKEPVTVIFDYNDELLYEKYEAKTDKQLYYEFMFSDRYLHKAIALNEVMDPGYLSDMVEAGIKDEFSGLRYMALNRFHGMLSHNSNDLVDLVSNDLDSKVRANALDILNDINPSEALKLAQSILISEPSLLVIGLAIDIIDDNNPELVLEKAVSLQNEPSQSFINKIAHVFARFGNETHLKFFETNIKKASRYNIFSIFSDLQTLLLKLEGNNITLLNSYLSNLSKDQNSSGIIRFLSTKTLSKIKEELVLRNTKNMDAPFIKEIQNLEQIILKIKQLETDEKIKLMYENIF